MVSASRVEIPHGLDLPIEFVNTLDPDEHTDALDTLLGLREWLAAKGLLGPGARVLRESDRRQAIRLREALLALMLAHNGVGADAGAAGVLEEVARRGELGV